MSIKSRVLSLCEQRKVRVGTLERETGMSNGTIRQWTDNSHPSTKTIAKIAEYFDVPVSDLLETETKKPDISVELSDAHRVLIDRVSQMSEDQAAAFLRALDAFQGIQ